MKKIISILICIQLALFPSLVLANATNPSIGGWSIASQVAQGVGTKITATKEVIVNGATKFAQSSAVITPNPKNIGDFLKRFGATAVAVTALDYLLDGVGYVMDPANNSIVIKKEGSIDGYLYLNNYTPQTSTIQSFNHATACKAIIKSLNVSHYVFGSSKGGAYPECWFIPYNGAGDWYQVAMHAFRDDTKSEEKVVPISDVATQIADKAEQDIKLGNPSSPAVALSRAVADEMITQAEKDEVKARPIADTLDKSSSIPTTQTAEGTITDTVVDPATGESKPKVSDLALEFPVFCNWAPNLCVLAQDATNFMVDVREWATAEPNFSDQQESDLEIEASKEIDKNPSSFDTDYITFGNQCPTFESYTVEVGSISETLRMDLQPLCDFAEKVRPAILGISYLTSAGIVIAAIRES